MPTKQDIPFYLSPGGGDKEKPKTDPEYEHTTPHENQPERGAEVKD